MFYGRSVSGRYGLGAPSCSFYSAAARQPKAKRPTIPVPVPVPVPVKSPKLGVGGGGGGGGGGAQWASGQVWRGMSRPWGRAVQTPTLRVQQQQLAASIPPHLQEQSTHARTHVKPTYLLRFSAAPRGCRHFEALLSPARAAKRCLPLLLVHASIFDCIPLDHNLPSHVRGHKERNMKKSYSPRRGVSPPGRPDRASRNVILDPWRATAGSRLQ